jgi:hypothetical protein
MDQHFDFRSILSPNAGLIGSDKTEGLFFSESKNPTQTKEFQGYFLK